MSEDKTLASKKFFKNRLKLEQEYDEIKLLAIGGMSEVYKARQTSLNRIVAIKKLKSALSTNPEMKERFFREAQAGASLPHENIAQVYQMGEVDGDHYIIMEYVEGMDLKNIIKTTRKIPWEIASLIAYRVAQGLEFAHQRGFIHRDIKPGNIMLSFRGEVKIMDFGIVRRLDSELTQTGAFLGTPAYMSPEQIKGQNITPQSDIFSLGVVLYEILTGEKPFKAETEQALVLKLTSEKPKSVRALNPAIPWRLARIVKRALKKDPRRRFKNAQEFAQAIQRLLGKKILNQASDLIAQYLRSVQNLAEEDRTKKTEQEDSEPVHLTGRPKTKKLKPKNKTEKRKEERKIIGEEWVEPPPSNWAVKTVILLVVTLALILGILLFHDQFLWFLTKLRNFFHF